MAGGPRRPTAHLWSEDRAHREVGGPNQLTYAGFPLHLYAGEEEPGQAIGHGSGDEWSVISPEGELLLDTPAD